MQEFGVIRGWNDEVSHSWTEGVGLEKGVIEGAKLFLLIDIMSLATAIGTKENLRGSRETTTE